MFFYYSLAAFFALLVMRKSSVLPALKTIANLAFSPSPLYYRHVLPNESPHRLPQPRWTLMTTCSGPAALTTVSFTYRSRLAPFVPERVRSLPIFARSHTYTPLATFNDQVQAGMSSQAFDIEANIRDGDARAGLDEVGTREVMEIMRTERVK